MRKAKIYFNHTFAGYLIQQDEPTKYRFEYEPTYQGPGISLTLPKKNSVYSFDTFPPFFEGFLPEGAQLEAMLRQAKLDRRDYFGQLVTVGGDLIGAITVKGEA